MNAVLQQLSDLARAAEHHAAEVHDLQIANRPASETPILAVVDQVLDRERQSGRIQERESLTLCYGAWFGEFAVSHYQCAWVGLTEPTPPRLSVCGIHCSPLDAVRRRLTSDRAPRLQELSAQMANWQRAAEAEAKYREHNRDAWDARLQDGRFVSAGDLPANREEALAAIEPWLLDSDGSLEHRRLLCLAAGGGRHGPLHALAGADVAVVDFSAMQLQLDTAIALKLGLTLQTHQGTMEDLSDFENASFDAVIQPVSLCYVRDVMPVYREIARVLRPDGLYIAQHKQAACLQAKTAWENDGYQIVSVAGGLSLPEPPKDWPHRESGMIEFAHSLDTLVGGLCRCGFVIEDLQEPPRGDAWAEAGSPEHRALFLPPYLKIKARRVR